jgi:hypothetical protein
MQREVGFLLAEIEKTPWLGPIRRRGCSVVLDNSDPVGIVGKEVVVPNDQRQARDVAYLSRLTVMKKHGGRWIKQPGGKHDN